jgi:hypothetical protein
MMVLPPGQTTTLPWVTPEATVVLLFGTNGAT